MYGNYRNTKWRAYGVKLSFPVIWLEPAFRANSRFVCFINLTTLRDIWYLCKPEKIFINELPALLGIFSAHTIQNVLSIRWNTVTIEFQRHSVPAWAVPWPIHRLWRYATTFASSHLYRLPCMGSYRKRDVWTQVGHRMRTASANFWRSKSRYIKLQFLVNLQDPSESNRALHPNWQRMFQTIKLCNLIMLSLSL